jgi:hypothetical protein
MGLAVMPGVWVGPHLLIQAGLRRKLSAHILNAEKGSICPYLRSRIDSGFPIDCAANDRANWLNLRGEPRDSDSNPQRETQRARPCEAYGAVEQRAVSTSQDSARLLVIGWCHHSRYPESVGGCC